jgi:hypothetical protein
MLLKAEPPVQRRAQNIPPSRRITTTGGWPGKPLPTEMLMLRPFPYTPPGVVSIQLSSPLIGR